jgi:hypothetical protein
MPEPSEVTQSNLGEGFREVLVPVLRDPPPPVGGSIGRFEGVGAGW